jgi:uncharacterized membrane protein YqgA involved in biofilm formation
MVPVRGTLLNTVTVAAGSLVGLGIGRFLPIELKSIVLSGLGLITIGMGIKLFLGSKNVLIVAAALLIGGIIGTLFHIQGGINSFGDWSKQVFGGQGSATFTEGVVTSSILFCVGPMTLMGCLQEAIEGRIELIAIKSTLDGFAALFLTVALGPGVLLSAGVVLIVQGVLTLLGSRLKKMADNESLIAEANAVGGPILLAIGIGLLEIKRIPAANYLPALVFAPLFAWFFHVKLGKKEL